MTQFMADVPLQLWEKLRLIWIEVEGTNQCIGDCDDQLLPFLLAQKLSYVSSVSAAAGMVESSQGYLPSAELLDFSLSWCSSGKRLNGKKVMGTFPVPHFITAGSFSASLNMLNRMKHELTETAVKSDLT